MKVLISTIFQRLSVEPKKLKAKYSRQRKIVLKRRRPSCDHYLEKSPFGTGGILLILKPMD